MPGGWLFHLLRGWKVGGESLTMEKTVVELFAGVGGFRLGLERLQSGWKTVWFSQWEPGRKAQWAYECYVRHFGEGDGHTGMDISLVPKETIPDHTLLVGGFPCQDYSVARTQARGIEGKKGVLWWQIRDILRAKRPPFCIFENVDRLLRSPASQRGRDLGIILASLAGLGYSAEWRAVNAADYGAAQRRRRTFLFAYRDDTEYGTVMQEKDAGLIIGSEGFMARAFPVLGMGGLEEAQLPSDIREVSEHFSFHFLKAGYMHKGHISTADITEDRITSQSLGSILQSNVDEKYYIAPEKMAKWAYLKGAKKIERISSDGYRYVFSEGAVPFPDPLDKPARTMLTSGSTLNRSTHVVADQGRLRILTPIEAERLQGFDDGWTEGMPERMRYHCMGNALVVPMVTRMGRVLDPIIEDEGRSKGSGTLR